MKYQHNNKKQNQKNRKKRRMKIIDMQNVYIIISHNNTKAFVVSIHFIVVIVVEWGVVITKLLLARTLSVRGVAGVDVDAHLLRRERGREMDKREIKTTNV